MSFKAPLTVEMDGGDTYEVIVDQRDLAAAEADENGSHDRPATRLRFLAWNAAKRSGRYSGTFPAWNGKDCLWVGSLDEEDESDDEPADAGA